MSIKHGDTIVLRGSPLYIKGFTSYVKMYANWLVIHWANEKNRPNDALEFIVGDKKKIGQPILTGEPVNLISVDGKGPVLNSEMIYQQEKWSQHSVNKFKIVFSCDGIKDGTKVYYSNPYWIAFEHSFIKWGVENGMYNLVEKYGSKPIVFMMEKIEKIINSGGDGISLYTPNFLSNPNPKNTPLPKKVYYTIDDSCSEYTGDIVEYVDKHSLPVIWFINGLHSCSPHNFESLKKICASPNCTVAIHTWDHANMAKMPIYKMSQQIAMTIALVERAHTEIGKKWEGLRLFRYPFTDDGMSQGNDKYEEMQQVLETFRFNRHEDIQKSIFGRGVHISGLFIEDGLYKTSSKEEFEKHLDERFRFFNSTFNIMFKDTLVFGTHDTKHSVTTLKFLVENGVEFIDPNDTYTPEDDAFRI